MLGNENYIFNIEENPEIEEIINKENNYNKLIFKREEFIGNFTNKIGNNTDKYNNNYYLKK